MSFNHKHKYQVGIVIVRNAVWALALLLVAYSIVLCIYHGLMALLYENNVALASITLCMAVLLYVYYRLIRMIE